MKKQLGSESVTMFQVAHPLPVVNYDKYKGYWILCQISTVANIKLE